MKYFFWIAFAVFLAASIPHVAYFFASFEPAGGPQGVWWWTVSYAIAISIDVTIYLLSWTAFQRYRRYRSAKAVWQHWLLIVMCTVFSWVVNWAYAKQFHNPAMLSAAETTATWLTNVFPFLASAFPLLGLVYTMMAETISETEAQEKQERAQQSSVLVELAKQTNLPITTLRRALNSGSRFTAASLMTLTNRVMPKSTTAAATPSIGLEQPDPHRSTTDQTARTGATFGDIAQPVNEPGAFSPFAAIPASGNTDKLHIAPMPASGNTDKLQMAIEALRANPAITDEALAEYLALKRPASARFWRMKAIEILSTQASESEERQNGQAAPFRYR